ncbi:MAG: TolC family protein [Bacteroidales bacterium]|nr:TolC family protein [Bacteroidales bacterium]
MKTYNLLILILLCATGLYSQTGMDVVILQVEKNNTLLNALRQEKDARLVGNRTMLYPPNPEVEFNYLWGNPSNISDRIDLSVTQSFDFPTTYTFKKQIAHAKNDQAELWYEQSKRNILLETRLICLEIIHHNARINELKRRLKHAQSIENSVRMKYEKGESGLMDWNKAKLTLMSLTSEFELESIRKRNNLSELARLNGSIPLDFPDSTYEIIVLPADFDNWYAGIQHQIPYLALLEQQVLISRQEEKLAQALSLPRFFAGYMRESSKGDLLQGVTAGLTLPLWENKNAVKYIQLQSMANRDYAIDAGLQYYNQMKALYEKAVGLQNALNDFKSLMESMNNSLLLKKVYDSGELSLIEYMLELSVYYESIDRMLDTELELNLAVVRLNQFK